MTAISTPVKALWVRCTAVWTIVLLSTAQCALQIQFGRLYRSYRMSRNAELGTEGWNLRGSPVRSQPREVRHASKYLVTTRPLRRYLCRRTTNLSSQPVTISAGRRQIWMDNFVSRDRRTCKAIIRGTVVGRWLHRLC